MRPMEAVYLVIEKDWDEVVFMQPINYLVNGGSAKTAVFEGRNVFYKYALGRCGLGRRVICI